MSESYQSCLAHLYGLQKHGIKLGLETMRAVLARLHHPELAYAVLHIGGTNGKGSTAAMVAAILRAAGIRVGLYTSPHLVDFRERIQVQGEPIAECRVIDLVQRFRGLNWPTPSPTFFEFTTAMAFQYFSEEHVDIAVLEVGMGGRFDATNVCKPIGTLITNVGKDHEAYLGDTLRAIAFEKAGIIKAGVPLVMGPMPEEAREVLIQMAQEKHVPVSQYGTDFHITGGDSQGFFDYQSRSSTYGPLRCGLKGDHQLVNAACAIAVIEQSILPYRSISPEAIAHGLSSVTWEGRLETLGTHPFLVCDGAHNPAAAMALSQYLKRQTVSRVGRRLIIVLAMMRDKNIAAFVSHLLPLSPVVICTQIDHPRSATAEELQHYLSPHQGAVYVIPDTAEAIAFAKKISTSEDLICVTGSLFLVGAVKSMVAGSAYAPVVG